MVQKGLSEVIQLRLLLFLLLRRLHQVRSNQIRSRTILTQLEAKKTSTNGELNLIYLVLIVYRVCRSRSTSSSKTLAILQIIIIICIIIVMAQCMQSLSGNNDEEYLHNEVEQSLQLKSVQHDNYDNDNSNSHY